MSIDALVFDVDGTLADTEETHRRAFNGAFDQLGLGWAWPTDFYRSLLQVTGGKERIVHFIDGLALPAAETARLIALVPAIHARKTVLYTDAVRDGAVTLRDGVQRLIEQARTAGCRLAIASTTTAANIDALLQVTIGPQGRDLFAAIACGDEVRAKKPAPDVYRLALQRLGVQAAAAVAFEDSEPGLQAARAAHLWTVVTLNPWTSGGDFSAAALVLPSLGSADQPWPGEPGRKLANAAWLNFDELRSLHGAQARAGPAAGNP